MSTRRSANESFGDPQFPVGNGQQPESAAPSSSNTSTSPANNHAEDSSPMRSDMTYYHSFLTKLLDLISHGEEEEVSRIVSVIRSGASHRQILDIIDQSSESGNRESNGVSNRSE